MDKELTVMSDGRTVVSIGLEPDGTTPIDVLELAPKQTYRLYQALKEHYGNLTETEISRQNWG